jgi:zinc protease
MLRATAVVLVGLALLAAVRPAAPGTLDPKTIRETVFPSGLRLLVKEAHGADLASIQVWIRAGGFLEDESTTGYAHVIEHLVFKGTDRHGPGDIDQTIEDLGGELSATTEKDWTMYGTTVASPHAMRVIEVLGDALRNAKLRPADYKVEQRALLDEIGEVLGDPERLAATALFRMAFQRHPYARDARGTPRVVQNLKLDALHAHFLKYYVPQNMTVVVVGDVTPTAVEQHVRKAFAADAAPTAPAVRQEPYKLPEPETACQKPRRETLDTPFGAAYVGLAFPAPGAGDQPDVYAMDLILTLLEHAPYGRLPAALRGKASVKASFETRRQPGLLTILAQVDPSLREVVEKTLRDEIQRLIDQPPPAAELEFTKRVLAGSYALENETFSGQAGTLGFYAAINQWQFATTYLERVQRVTPEQLQATIKKYLSLEHCCTLVLQPRSGDGGRPPGRTGSLGEYGGMGVWAYGGVGAPAQKSPPSTTSSLPHSHTPTLPHSHTPTLPYSHTPIHFQQPKAAATPKPAVRRVVLANGLTLLCKQNDSSEIAAIVCQVRAGLADEPDDRNGLAAMTAEAILRGTSNHTRQGFAQAVVNAGGSLGAQNTWDFTEITAVTDRDRWQNALKLVADVIAHPSFETGPEGNLLDDVRTAIKQRAAGFDSDFASGAYQAMMAQLYRSGPYGHPIYGTPSSLGRITLSDLRQFWRNNYVQNRITVAIVGDVDTAAAIETAQKAFADVPFRAAGPPREIPRDNIDRPRADLLQRPAPAGQVMVGYLAPPATPANYAVMSLLEAIVGGGKRSRLYANIREKRGMGYTMAATYQPLLGQSHFIAFMLVPAPIPDRESPAIEEPKRLLLEQFRLLADTGATDAEVARARAYVIGAHALRHERNRDQAKWMSWAEAAGLGVAADQDFPAMVNAVTKEQIQAAAKELFKNYALVVSLPPPR